jgi:DNA-binding CsgD family transcriptional regulator
MTLPLTTDLPGRIKGQLVPAALADEGDARAAGVQVELVGRSQERLGLDRTLDGLRSGQGSTLVMHGEPGVGKTALLEYLQDRATGCQVVTASAAESEMRFAFAGLHQLCAPLLDHLEQLPAPQRTALGTAFGLMEGVPPNPLFLGLAVLSLMSDAAESRPLLCVVDDAQWLDQESSQVLTIAARRLVAEPIALVVATRERATWPTRVHEMRVQGLSERDARALLRTAMRGPLDEQVAERMVAEANGNPRTLLEAVRGLTPTQLAGGFGRPDAGLAVGGVHTELTRRLAALSDETRLFLVVAAAEPLGEPLLLWRAAEQLGIPADAADAARDAALLDVGSRVRFRHPEARAALYRHAAPEELRRAHRALADVTDQQANPARRTWHRACVACAPDEDIAAELERSAGSAAVRGGLAAKSSFLSKAAVLTPEPEQRARRALAAAETAWQAGDTDGAVRGVVVAEAGPLDQLGRARAAFLRARIDSDSDEDDAARRLFEAGRRLEPLDIELARDAYLEALEATIRLSRTPGRDALEVARAAVAARRTDAPRPTDLLMDGITARVTDGLAAAEPRLRRAVTALADDVSSTGLGVAAGWLASQAACMLWEDDLRKTIVERHVRIARNAGARPLLGQALTQRIEIHLREGELVEADAVMRELDSAAGPAAGEASRQVAMLTAAYRGRDEDARRLIAEARTASSPASRGAGAFLIEFAELLLDNGLGRYADALHSSRCALEDSEAVGWAHWALPELVEAAARAGAVDEAATALRRLGESARISGTDLALGLAARSRALLSDGPEAEQSYVEALALLGRTHLRPELARAHLLYGEWLRRENRRVDARAQLRAAHEQFTSIGMEAFAQRAHRELEATGEKARKRTAETRDELTAQECQIARMARDGLSNPEIGARLFLSPRTVEWHLRKIFVKLGITSRFALGDALPEPAELSA